MKYLINTIILFLGTLSLYAGSYNIDNIEITHLKDAKKYVCNPDNILSPAIVDSIDAMLVTLEKKNGIEILVVVAENVEPDCYTFALTLGNKYGVGKSNNNGLVVVLSTQQRIIQFVTGYGLEGDLPDATCKKIQTIYMTPYLANNKWDEGMLSGMTATCQYLDGKISTTELDSTNENINHKNKEYNYELLEIIFIIIITIICFIIAYFEKKCPSCKRHQLQTEKKVTRSALFYKVIEYTCTCKNCGYQKTKTKKMWLYNSKGNFFLLNSGRSRGGHFGGGSFGGGGSSSRF